MQDQAKQYGKLAVALARQGQWAEALRHAHACRELAEPGSVLYVWSLHTIACISADVGRLREARAYALAYLKAAPSMPELEQYTPFVLLALGWVHHYERRSSVAVSLWKRALHLFTAQGNEEETDRTRIRLAWAHLRAGRTQEAQEALQAVRAGGYLRDGAEAAILAAQGRHREAVEMGQRALRCARRSCDFVEAAEVALVLAGAFRALGETWEADAWNHLAADLAARQEQDAYALLVLSQRAGGGELLHVSAATDSRGSRNLHHRGCFSTGVA